jgi:hypothetical protein
LALVVPFLDMLADMLQHAAACFFCGAFDGNTKS